MKTFLFLMFGLTFSSFTFAKKYYTLTSGNWNNTSSVWPLNNATPCGCFPGYTINLDTLTINHPLNLTGTVNSSSAGRIRINPSGSVNSTVSDIVVNNSVVLSFGAVNIRSLNVGAGGIFSIKSASLVINLNYDNFGTTILDNAAIHQMNGNLNIYAGSVMQLTNSSYLQSLLGNLKNEGTIQLCPTCCLQLEKGNLTNQSGAVFQGNGAVNLTNGTIKNFGSWDPAILYCSSGNDQGITSTENCIQSKQVCLITNTGLPSSLISFEGSPFDTYNFLEWRTASEAFQEYYQLDHSTDGQNWNTLTTIPANGNDEETSSYQYVDSLPISQIMYYRLTKYDGNNAQMYSKQLSIKSTDDPRVIIFPNPTDADVIVRCLSPHDYTLIELLDSNGKYLFSIPLEADGNTKLSLPDGPGNFYIQLHGHSRTTVFSVVKY